MENKNMVFIDEAKRDERKVKSDLEILYIHMIKYKFLSENQDSDWVKSIHKSLINLNRNMKNKSIYNKLIKECNRTLDRSINIAIDEIKIGFDKSIRKQYVANEIYYDQDISWTNISDITDKIKISKWLYKYYNPNSFQSKSVKILLDNHFDQFGRR